MSLRELPNFLMHGDAELDRLMLAMRDGEARMRTMMGMPTVEPAPAEGTAARDWLRHVEAGRIGRNSA